MCVDSRRLSTWIKDHINKDRDKIASTSEESIRDKISTWIKNTVDDKQYERRYGGADCKTSYTERRGQ